MSVITLVTDPGFVELTNSDYRKQTDWVSISELNLFRVAPILYKHRIIDGHREPPTAAQDKGIAVHTAVLEPAVFVKEYASLPEGTDLRTTVGKNLKKKLEDENPGIKFMKPDEYELITGTARSVLTRKNAVELLNESVAEQSYFWVDEETGVKCKARADSLSLTKRIVTDLKTTKDVREFDKSVMGWSYHRQAAFYLDGLSSVTGDVWTEWYWIAVSVEAPHLCREYKADYKLLDLGREEYRSALRAFKICKETNVWPGLPDEIETISLPSWLGSKRNNVTEESL